jgi:hypothetical protein
LHRTVDVEACRPQPSSKGRHGNILVPA